MARDPGIYVEILIRAGVDDLWRYTQVPEMHELWDLRFTSIDYLAKASEDEPQRFRYSTRIGFGWQIDGEGESTGTRADAAGVRTSSLKFWSEDPRALIQEGSGYWQYIPTADGVRFLTWYDYRTRFGKTGRWMDRHVFRPMIGWATAWSFDRLRLWIEQGKPPEMNLRLALIHALARWGIAFTWLWQGLAPKLLFPSADERAMMAAAHLPLWMVPAIGALEVGCAAATLLGWRWRPFFFCNAAVMIAALAGVAHNAPAYLVAAFNPVTLNLGMILLSAIGYVASAGIPSASRCLRRAPRGTV